MDKNLVNIYLEESYDFAFEAILFFDARDSNKHGHVAPTVSDFVGHFNSKYPNQILKTRVMEHVFRRLVEVGIINEQRFEGPHGMRNRYSGFMDQMHWDNREDPIVKEILSVKLHMLLFGFPTIYGTFQKIVYPILHVKDGCQQLGTCFVSEYGLITARHCLENADTIAIQGINKSELDKAEVYFHKRPEFDVAVIKIPNFGPSIKFIPEMATPTVLENVIALGFPKIAGYQNFLTAERADISARFTVTRGSVAALAEDIWLRERLVLITAKIRGGNSGGPIINEYGQVVGVAANAPAFEGDRRTYDDLGYGVIFPSDLIVNEIQNQNFELNNSLNGKFDDFP